MKSLDIIKVLTGGEMLGNITQGFNLVKILKTDDSGFDDLKEFILFRIFERTELTEEEYNTDRAFKEFKKIQTFLRGRLQEDINRFAEEQRQKHEKELKSGILKKLKERNAPNKHGTVDELSEKLGISKKAIRKMRAEGTLDQYIEQELKK